MANPNLQNITLQRVHDPVEMQAIATGLRALRAQIDNAKDSRVKWHNEAKYEKENSEFLQNMDATEAHFNGTIDAFKFDTEGKVEDAKEEREAREDLEARFALVVQDGGKLPEKQRNVLDRLRQYCLKYPHLMVMLVDDGLVKRAVEDLKAYNEETRAQLEQLDQKLHQTGETMRERVVAETTALLAEAKAAFGRNMEQEVDRLKAVDTMQMEKANNLSSHLFFIIESLETRLEKVEDDYKKDYSELEEHARDLAKTCEADEQGVVLRQREYVQRLGQKDDQHKLELDNVQAQLERTETRLERTETRLERTETRLELTAAQLKEARAQLKGCQTQLDQAAEHADDLRQAKADHVAALAEKDKQHRETLEKKDSEREKAALALKEEHQVTCAEKDRQHATALEEEKSRVQTVLEDKITLETQAKEATERIGILKANARGLLLEKTVLEAQVKGNEQVSNEKDARILGLEKETRELREQSILLEQRAQTSERAGKEKDTRTQQDADLINVLQGQRDGLALEQAKSLEQHKADEERIRELEKRLADTNLARAEETQRLRGEHGAAIREITSFLICTVPAFGIELNGLLSPVGQAGPFDRTSLAAVESLVSSFDEMPQQTAPDRRGIAIDLQPGITFPARMDARSLPSEEVSMLAFQTLCHHGRPFTLSADHLAGGPVTSNRALMMIDSVPALRRIMEQGEPVEASDGILSLFLLQTILALRQLGPQPWPENDSLTRDLHATVRYEAFGEWLSQRLQLTPSALVQSLLSYVYELGGAEQQRDWVEVAVENYAGRPEYLLDSSSDLEPGWVLLHDELGTFLLVRFNDPLDRRIHIFGEESIRRLSLNEDSEIGIELDVMTGVPEHQRILNLGKTSAVMKWVGRLPQRLFVG